MSTSRCLAIAHNPLSTRLFSRPTTNHADTLLADSPGSALHATLGLADTTNHIPEPRASPDAGELLDLLKPMPYAQAEAGIAAHGRPPDGSSPIPVPKTSLVVGGPLEAYGALPRPPEKISSNSLRNPITTEPIT